MSETTSWTDHVLVGATWRRFLFMLLFAPLLGCVGFLIACIALFQFFGMLASGESNPQLRALGRDLSRFGLSIMDYLTYNTEQKPFPFTPCPHTTVPEDPPWEATKVTSPVAAPETSESLAGEPQLASRRATTARRKRTAARTAPTRRRAVTTGRAPPPVPPPDTTKPDADQGGDEGDRSE